MTGLPEAARQALEAQQGPVACVTECEACFTPDACRLRGTCDHYSAEKLRVSAAAQPQGWVLVPEEPTMEMLRAGESCFVVGFVTDNRNRDVTASAYRAMLAARPQQKEPQA